MSIEDNDERVVLSESSTKNYLFLSEHTSAYTSGAVASSFSKFSSIVPSLAERCKRSSGMSKSSGGSGAVNKIED